jgi:hypothetical protein
MAIGTAPIGASPLGGSRAASVTWQYVYPTSDIASNGWLPSTGSDMFAMVDEVTRDDGDFIYSPNDPTTQAFEMKFAAPTGTLGTTDNYWDYALEARNLDTTFDLNLVQGTTVLDSWSEAVTAGAGVVERTHAFSAGVLATITDKTDVRVRGVARAT